MLFMAVARSSSDENAIRYVFLVLRMTSYFHIKKPVDQNRRRCECFVIYTAVRQMATVAPRAESADLTDVSCCCCYYYHYCLSGAGSNLKVTGTYVCESRGPRVSRSLSIVEWLQKKGGEGWGQYRPVAGLPVLVPIALHPWSFISDEATFVLKRNVKLQLSN